MNARCVVHLLSFFWNFDHYIFMTTILFLSQSFFAYYLDENFYSIIYSDFFNLKCCSRKSLLSERINYSFVIH